MLLHSEVHLQAQLGTLLTPIRKLAAIHLVRRSPGGAAGGAASSGSPGGAGAGAPGPGADPLAQAMGGLGFGGGGGAGSQADMIQQMMQSPMAQVATQAGGGSSCAAAVRRAAPRPR